MSNRPLIHKYSHKIKTIEELQETIGEFPRKKSVVLCHGVFDVIHPGHLRHLIYAKEKASLLVVSLTADCHIKKGHYRPHIPEDLRAANMAAYELVDYVVIDRNAKPLKNIEQVKPDYFCKGFEYSPDGKVNPRTQEEIDALSSYGGRVIFTPGDHVYSSSKLINLAPPDIKYEKLELLLNRSKISFEDLRKTLSDFSNKKVHVVGDTIVDSYTQCEMIGGQTKTPTMSVLFQEKKDYVGGAAVVAKHLKSAGANVVFTTVLGEDSLKNFVVKDLKKNGIECNENIDPLRPTVNKNAIIARNYRLLKIDTLDNASIPQDTLESICQSIKNTPSDAVIFSDFRHGIFNRSTVPCLIKSLPNTTLKVADSQVASRWGDISEFKGFDLITPNEREARFSLRDQDSGVRSLASQLHKKADCKYLILKLGDKGLLCSRSHDFEKIDSFFLVDSFVDDLVDPVGSGDALLAYSTLALLASGSIVQATILGSIAAACECEYDGNISVTPEDVLKKLNSIEKNVTFPMSEKTI
ncbi:PfkB family carbohydrate kinase [Alphaproteobacteria bacterium]|nr:PfkB family carbohydrate kinase [Alphaproteobacteria bacterium]